MGYLHSRTRARAIYLTSNLEAMCKVFFIRFGLTVYEKQLIYIANRWCWWHVFKAFHVGLLTSVQQYDNLSTNRLFRTITLIVSSTTTKQYFWIKLVGLVRLYASYVHTNFCMILSSSLPE